MEKYPDDLTKAYLQGRLDGQRRLLHEALQDLAQAEFKAILRMAMINKIKREAYEAGVEIR